MTAETFGKLLAGVSALTLEERRQLRDAIDRSLDPANREAEVELALIKAGLLIGPPLEPVRGSSYRECDVIMVSGSPMSETIVEERR